MDTKKNTEILKLISIIQKNEKIKNDYIDPIEIINID